MVRSCCFVIVAFFALGALGQAGPTCDPYTPGSQCTQPGFFCDYSTNTCKSHCFNATTSTDCSATEICEWDYNTASYECQPNPCNGQTCEPCYPLNGGCSLCHNQNIQCGEGSYCVVNGTTGYCAPDEYHVCSTTGSGPGSVTTCVSKCNGGAGCDENALLYCRYDYSGGFGAATYRCKDNCAPYTPDAASWCQFNQDCTPTPQTQYGYEYPICTDRCSETCPDGQVCAQLTVGGEWGCTTCPSECSWECYPDANAPGQFQCPSTCDCSFSERCNRDGTCTSYCGADCELDCIQNYQTMAWECREPCVCPNGQSCYFDGTCPTCSYCEPGWYCDQTSLSCVSGCNHDGTPGCADGEYCHTRTVTTYNPDGVPTYTQEYFCEADQCHDAATNAYLCADDQACNNGICESRCWSYDPVTSMWGPGCHGASSCQIYSSYPGSEYWQCVDPCGNACWDYSAPCSFQDDRWDCHSLCTDPACAPNEQCSSTYSGGVAAYECMSRCGECAPHEECTEQTLYDGTYPYTIWTCGPKSCDANLDCPIDHYCFEGHCALDNCIGVMCEPGATCNRHFGVCFADCSSFDGVCPPGTACTDPALANPCVSLCNDGLGCLESQDCVQVPGTTAYECADKCREFNNGQDCADGSSCIYAYDRVNGGYHYTCVDACGNWCNDDQYCDATWGTCVSNCATATSDGCRESEKCEQNADGAWSCVSQCNNCDAGQTCLAVYDYGTWTTTWQCGDFCDRCHDNETCVTYTYYGYTYGYCEPKCGWDCAADIYGHYCSEDAPNVWTCKSHCPSCFNGYCMLDVDEDPVDTYSCVPYCQVDGCGTGSECSLVDGYCHSLCEEVCDFWSQSCVPDADGNYFCQDGCADCPSGYCYRTYSYYGDSPNGGTSGVAGETGSGGGFHCYDACWDTCSADQECVVTEGGWGQCMSKCNGGAGCAYQTEECVELAGGFACVSKCDDDCAAAGLACVVTEYSSWDWRPVSFACRSPCWSLWTNTDCADDQHCETFTYNYGWGSYSWSQCKFNDPCRDSWACDWSTQTCQNVNGVATCVDSDACADVRCDYGYCFPCDANTAGDWRCAGVSDDHVCVSWWGQCYDHECTSDDACSYSYCSIAADGYSPVCSSWSYYDGTACDDSDSNTVGDACWAGVCAGTFCDVPNQCGDVCCDSDQKCEKFIHTKYWGLDYQHVYTSERFYYYGSVGYYCLERETPVNDAVCYRADGVVLGLGETYTTTDGCETCQCTRNVNEDGTLVAYQTYGIACLPTGACRDPAADDFCLNANCEAEGKRCVRYESGGGECVPIVSEPVPVPDPCVLVDCVAGTCTVAYDAAGNAFAQCGEAPATCDETTCDSPNGDFYCDPTDGRCHERPQGCPYLDERTGEVVYLAGGTWQMIDDCNWCDCPVNGQIVCTKFQCGYECETECNAGDVCVAVLGAADSCLTPSCDNTACDTKGTIGCTNGPNGPECVCDAAHTGAYCELQRCDPTDANACASFGFGYCSAAGFCTCEPGRTGADGGCNALVPEVTGDDRTEVTNDGTLICVAGYTTADGSTSGGWCVEGVAADDATDSGVLAVGNCANLELAIADAQAIEAALAVQFRVDTSNVYFTVVRATEVSGTCTNVDEICELQIKVRSSTVINLTATEKAAIQQFALSLITEYGYTFCSLEVSSCNDGDRNGDEEDVDCGGSCDAVCDAPTCEDGRTNGDETGPDCGGSCNVACDETDVGVSAGAAVTPMLVTLFAVVAVRCLAFIWA